MGRGTIPGRRSRSRDGPDEGLAGGSVGKTLESLRGMGEWLLHDSTGRALAVALVLAYVLAWWRILARAGFPGALAVLMWIPPVALAIFLFVAFAPWPARRELHALRKVQRVVHQAEKRRLIA
jgi:hypothetical protein